VGSICSRDPGAGLKNARHLPRPGPSSPTITVVILGIGTNIIGSVSDSIVYVGIVAILGFICGFFVDIGIVGIQSRVDVSSMSMIFINVITFLGSMVIIKKIIDDINYSIHKSILYAQNLKKSLGFDVKYMKGAIIPTSIKLANKITMLKKHLKKVKDEKEKQELQKNLEEVQKEKEHVLEKEAHAKTQQIKIQNALNHILKPYEYIEKNISKLRKHNYFFYGVIIILLSVFTYALFENYIDTRTLQFQKILEKDSVSFGAIFGVILFYSTPILFGMSIIVYAITQINKNIQSMETMQEQRRAIEVLQSTLLAQTEIADVSDDEIKALTQALQKGALERMFGQDKISQGSEKATSSYREKLLLNSLNKFLMQALKK